MGNYVLNFFRSIGKTFGTDGVFYLFLAVEGLNFTISLLVMLYSRRIKTKTVKRSFCIASLSVLLIETGIIILSNVDSGGIIFHVLFNTAVILIFALFLSLIPENFAWIKPREKRLIKDIDKQIKEQMPYIEKDKKIEFYKTVDSKEDLLFNREKEQTSLRQTGCEGLDFTHVKNILSRVEGYNLSTLDQRQVGELKSAVYRAENYGADKELKTKINDGLGALLKIMSKYGV